METITWEIFDGARFQKFCNEFLLLEVSKHASVFSALGPDGGIDQLFRGTYGEKSGLWRFQDKFHFSGNKTKDYSALRADVRADIRNNYKEENFLVFFTNLNLTPRQYQDTIDLAKNTLLEVGGDCEPIIWHKAFIEARISSHPLLFQWYWGKFSTSILRIDEFFKNTYTPGRNSFTNTFVGREEDIETLNTFLSSEKSNTLAIVSNGGFGKTRLCLEFMKILEKEDAVWIPCVLVNSGYNSNEFRHLLGEPNRLLILVDNANEIPEVIDDIKRQIEATNGKSKLILTTRSTLFNNTFGGLSSHNSWMEKRILRPLSPETTLNMLQLELPLTTHRNLLALRDISRGVPNLILELVRAVNNGENISELSIDNFFVKSVLRIFKEAAEDIFQSSGILKEKTIDFLELLSIISPISNTRESHQFIAEYLYIKEEKSESILTQLVEMGLVEKMPNISIKPDLIATCFSLKLVKKACHLLIV